MPQMEITISSVVELGKALRGLRKYLGLTLKDAAALCNVSLPFLNSLERGKPTVQLGKVLLVCQRFGIRIKLTSLG
jgi:transcriptional regulator with XRE-family HTH domain